MTAMKYVKRQRVIYPDTPISIGIGAGEAIINGFADYRIMTAEDCVGSESRPGDILLLDAEGDCMGVIQTIPYN